LAAFRRSYRDGLAPLPRPAVRPASILAMISPGELLAGGGAVEQLPVHAEALAYLRFGHPSEWRERLTLRR
jgi:hypothetical protein